MAVVGMATWKALCDVADERRAQDEKWGEQNHLDGTGTEPDDKAKADQARAITNRRAKAGTLTWRDIAREEVYEAFAEVDEVKLRAELIQAAAVFTAWAEAIDRRNSGDHR